MDNSSDEKFIVISKDNDILLDDSVFLSYSNNSTSDSENKSNNLEESSNESSDSENESDNLSTKVLYEPSTSSDEDSEDIYDKFIDNKKEQYENELMKKEDINIDKPNWYNWIKIVNLLPYVITIIGVFYTCRWYKSK
jgi:hypothetical protein